MMYRRSIVEAEGILRSVGYYVPRNKLVERMTQVSVDQSIRAICTLMGVYLRSVLPPLLHAQGDETGAAMLAQLPPDATTEVVLGRAMAVAAAGRGRKGERFTTGAPDAARARQTLAHASAKGAATYARAYAESLLELYDTALSEAIRVMDLHQAEKLAQEATKAASEAAGAIPAPSAA